MAEMDTINQPMNAVQRKSTKKTTNKQSFGKILSKKIQKTKLIIVVGITKIA